MTRLLNNLPSVPSWAIINSPITFTSELKQFSPPFDYLNNQTELTFEGLELWWSAITAGLMPPSKNNKKAGHITPFAQRSAEVTKWRAVSSLNFVQSTLNKHSSKYQLSRNQASTDLEPTETGQISYAIGSMMCRAFTAYKLDLPFSVHTKWVEDKIRFKQNIKSRPDYVCFDENQNIAYAEAKGRSGDWGNVKRDLANKLQMRALPHPTKGQRRIEVGCATLVSRDSAIEFFAADPEPSIDYIEFEPIEVAQEYYASLQALTMPLSQLTSTNSSEFLESQIQKPLQPGKKCLTMTITK